MGEKGTTVMRPKSRGSGIMVSDFIEENNGYLALTQAEYDEAKRVTHQQKCMPGSCWNLVKIRKGTGLQTNYFSNKKCC